MRWPWPQKEDLDIAAFACGLWRSGSGHNIQVFAAPGVTRFRLEINGIRKHNGPRTMADGAQPFAVVFDTPGFKFVPGDSGARMITGFGDPTVVVDDLNVGDEVSLVFDAPEHLRGVVEFCCVSTYNNVRDDFCVEFFDLSQCERAAGMVYRIGVNGSVEQGHFSSHGHWRRVALRGTPSVSTVQRLPVLGTRHYNDVNGVCAFG